MFTKPARGSMSDNAPMTDTDATADVTASVTTDTTEALDAGLDADSVFTSNDIRTLEPAHPGATAPSAPAPHAAHHSSGNFPSIGDYAFLSDCEANCLIAPSGAVEWMCVPRPDSPSIFTAILDRAGGSFRVAPFGVAVPAARRYLPGTLVLETTWQTPTGWLVVHDALIMAPWHNFV